MPFGQGKCGSIKTHEDDVKAASLCEFMQGVKKCFDNYPSEKPAAPIPRTNYGQCYQRPFARIPRTPMLCGTEDTPSHPTVTLVHDFVESDAPTDSFKTAHGYLCFGVFTQNIHVSLAYIHYLTYNSTEI
eukprot:m.685271 g.685271  ORF g.685271 m.685271 type:complete len:130 (-) comp22837_c0_seq2:825-1214(-)